MAGVRALEVFGAEAGSSSRERKIVSRQAHRLDCLPLDRFRPLHHSEVLAAERRAAALEASAERMLISAGVRAAEELKSTWPQLSAATLKWPTRTIPIIFGVLALAAMFAAPSTIVLSMFVVLPAAFRVWVVAHPAPTFLKTTLASPFSDAPDDEEPIYSVSAPLRAEARVVDQLLSAIERLNYPADKLDVIIAVEADDDATRAAITARRHRIPLTVIPVPRGGPATKPKALNVALPFARGMFTVIYDAEDRPERNQLRVALRTFRSAGRELACVQARLCIDTKTSWLARYFTAEYAGNFDVLLPKLVALGLPLPLGGSSNHFRTETLRKVGGWDPYNVTEDADLGMRLARFGYRSGVIDSSTYEEAPADVRRWLGQRTRWFKGWMQTWLVHMREPHRLLRELGFGGFLAFQLIVGGNAFVALAHPLFLVGMLGEFWTLISHGYHSAALDQAMHYLLIVVIGYFLSAYLGCLGLAHRGMLKRATILVCTPPHWLLLSLAAWLAAFELIRTPFRWRKTEHGLEGDSRQKNTTRSLLELERHLTDLKRRGKLAQIWD